MSELLNLIGLSTGLVLYAMLLAMVLRADRTPGVSTPLDPLLVATALLGLVWNLCALPAYALAKAGVAGPLTPFVAIGLSALGFLPAVVVHSVLRGDAHRLKSSVTRVVAVLSYGVSTIAAVLHAHAAWTGAAGPSSFGMQLLTYAYILLSIPVATVTRRQAGARRALWVAALSIFAVSALHLSQVHQGDASWPVELLGHHASVPLALAILYQDYPFALADLFLKRALTLLVLIAAAFLSVTALHAASAGPVGGPWEVGSLVVLWVATALLYPRMRDGIAWFVDSVILHRPDYASLTAAIAADARDQHDVATLIDSACGKLQPALSARLLRWREMAPDEPSVRTRLGAASALVEVPVTESPHFQIEVAGLAGGRRLLSDDHAALQAIASLLGRRIDAIRLIHERDVQQVREHEMSKLATEAELRALRSQINPHFLFNALTTIGYLIQTAPERALTTLMRLTSLLRAVLRSEGEFTTLGRELDLIEAYLEIERARFEHRLTVRIDAAEDLRRLRIPPLLLQPIVENAIKHGIAPRRDGGGVAIVAHMADDATLVLVVRDSGLGATERELRRGRLAGVGLANVERRLAAHYGDGASMSIVSAVGAGTTVEMRLPADPNPAGRVLPMTPNRNAS